MIAFMANVDYDFDTGSRWGPYVGGGLGVATISVDTEAASGTPTADSGDIVFAYQVGAASATSFPWRRAIQSRSAWTGDTSRPRIRPSQGGDGRPVRRRNQRT